MMEMILLVYKSWLILKLKKINIIIDGFIKVMMVFTLI